MVDEISTPNKSSFLTINKQNFNEITDNENLLLAKFYFDECQLCRDYLEDYLKLGEKLSTENIPPVKIALIDGETHNELMVKYLVNHDAHYILFKNGFPAFFSGRPKIDDVLGWIRSKLRSPIKYVETIQDVQEFLTENDVLVLGFFKDFESVELKVYCNVAYFLENKVFGVCSNDGLRNILKAENNSIMILKNTEEHEVFFKGCMCEKELTSFVQLYSTPIIAKYKKHKLRVELLRANKLHLFIFMAAASGHKIKYFDLLKEIALEYRDRILFVIADSDEEDIYDMYECFGLNLWETPRIRLIQWEDNGSHGAKYKPDTNEISADNIRNFLNSYFAGNLKRYYPSEPVCKEKNSSYILELVGENFDEVVFDETKMVVVFFYHPDVVDCIWTYNVYSEAAMLYERQEDIIIASINMKANELEHTVITEFPTIRLYTPDDNEMIEFKLTPTYENIMLFIDSEGDYNEPEPENEYDTSFCIRVCSYHH